jgi:hypothetical protein
MNMKGWACFDKNVSLNLSFEKNMKGQAHSNENVNHSRGQVHFNENVSHS